ncbi:methyl-accepting chemotaxis protein [Lacibacterium aquatile]|uniref:Methyl-accepting chemotaxis protein n=1 Tax=Lacibacterium aquatile TaxID=1168082 RepID=A0ABW5DJW9_9PROT
MTEEVGAAEASGGSFKWARISVMAQIIALVTLVLVGAQVVLLAFAMRSNEVVVYNIAVRDKLTTSAINSFSMLVNEYEGRQVGALAHVYSPQESAVRLPTIQKELAASWTTVLRELEAYLDPETVRSARQQVDRLPDFAERLRQAYVRGDDAAYIAMHKEWLTIKPGLDAFVAKVRARIEAAADENVEAADNSAELVQLLALSIGVIGAGVLIANWYVLSFKIARPVRDMAEAMRALADGHIGDEVQGTGRVGEIGMMARALKVFRAQAISSAELTDRVAQSIRQVATAANQASSAVSQVSDGSYTQLNALKQTAASLEQSSRAIADVARSTQLASEQAKNAADLAMGGIEQMADMVDIVTAIADSSAQVEQITGAIQRIAAQTNMLSLNAAIEAARAGEHGKGFAVVAEEVRKLADNSGALAQKIAVLVQQSTEATGRGVQMAEEVSGNMQRIAEGVKQSDRLVGAIAGAMEEQQATVGGINSNVFELTRIGQSNSTAAEEITATMVHLSKLADKTRIEVDQFKKLVN